MTGLPLPAYDRAPRCAACKGRMTSGTGTALCTTCFAAAERISGRELAGSYADWLRAVRREARRAAA